MPETRQPSLNGGPGSENPGEVNPDDVLDRGLPDSYPEMATPRALAKEYDPAFLHDCSAERLRFIARSYKNFLVRSPKVDYSKLFLTRCWRNRNVRSAKGTATHAPMFFLPSRNLPRVGS